MPSLGRSAAKSLTSVVVDILSSGFTYVACVPVTPTPFIRQPAGGHTTRVSEKFISRTRETYDVFSASSPLRRTTRGDHRGRVITREREDARGAGGREGGRAGGGEEARGGGRERERTKKKERKKARATGANAGRTLACKSISRTYMRERRIAIRHDALAAERVPRTRFWTKNPGAADKAWGGRGEGGGRKETEPEEILRQSSRYRKHKARSHVTLLNVRQFRGESGRSVSPKVNDTRQRRRVLFSHSLSLSRTHSLGLFLLSTTYPCPHSRSPLQILQHTRALSPSELSRPRVLAAIGNYR